MSNLNSEGALLPLSTEGPEKHLLSIHSGQ